ncbi:Na/Pi cotransporter family protein [Thiospirochaeta perfilievii]|uniref:Na/Pi cotransporter family protein n=1 Tax=Thiospirochaeta perfilievii TaxID=252967 RepID=A0A5C1QAJ3_9SPIO|nr:Na/Pi cotransporter family protein [Thiospirochaeta perfilievii]QEN05143.1 Na/Pi cotransporter family protein [Thiospirochaeta perfilievii]
MSTIFTSIILILEIVGCLGIFLYGMKIMSDGIQKAAGDKLQSVLNMMTSNRFMAVLTGVFVTAIVQSSSASTVMVVSFVNASLLNLTQAIGVIMGANIGTTVTSWIIAVIGKVSMSHIAIPCIGIGMPMMMFSKKGSKKNWGEFFVGFGLLFLGLSLLKDLLPGKSEAAAFMASLEQLTDLGYLSILLFVAVGAIATIIIHSSSATMGVILILVGTDGAGIGLPFEVAAAMALGSNIGTTIDAFLASIAANTAAKRAAMVHILFNVFGTILALIFFYPFLKLVNYIIPGDDPRFTLAMFHTIFNVTATLIFVWFIPQFAKLVTRIVRESEVEYKDQPYTLEYMNTGFQDMPEIYLLKAKNEVRMMSDIVQKMYSSYRESICGDLSDFENALNIMKKQEDYTDQMQEELSQFLLACTKDNLNDDGFTNAASLMRIVNELESIGDSCYKLMIILNKQHEQNLKFHETAIEDLKPYEELVAGFLNDVVHNLSVKDENYKIADAQSTEEKINSYRSTLKKAARRQIQGGSDVKAELLYIDLLRQIEHIGDFCMNIMQEMENMK